MERVRVDITLPRGPEHYWRMMGDLTRKAGGFTISDIWGLTNGRSRKTLKTYFSACLKSAAIEAVATSANGAVTYRVVNLNAPAPVVRRATFTGERGRIQQQIWTTLRGLPQFTIRELAIEASTDEVAVKERAAKDYVKALLDAGYLAAIVPSQALTVRGVFRLKPTMNTGPKAPALFKACFLFDRNTKAPVGLAVGTAEDAS